MYSWDAVQDGNWVHEKEWVVMWENHSCGSYCRWNARPNIAISRDWGRLLWLKREWQDWRGENWKQQFFTVYFYWWCSSKMVNTTVKKGEGGVKKQPTRRKQKPWSYKIRSILFRKAASMKLWELYCCYVVMRLLWAFFLYVHWALYVYLWCVPRACFFVPTFVSLTWDVYKHKIIDADNARLLLPSRL